MTLSYVLHVNITYTSQCHMLLWSATLKSMMYSSKLMSVLDEISQDLIVYSEVLCFQVTLALTGSLSGCEAGVETESVPLCTIDD